MKIVYAIISILLISIMASTAVPALASSNLLQNPGFETDPWTPPWFSDTSYGGYPAAISSLSHTGARALKLDGANNFAAVYQNINPPQSASYLEFWYIATYGTFGPSQLGVVVFYSDGWSHLERLTYQSDWTQVHIKLDVSKQVETVRVFAGYETVMYIRPFA